MSTEHRYSTSDARVAARVALTELAAAGDNAWQEPDYWVGRLRTALSHLLGAEPATPAECDEIIKAAIVAKSRLLGEPAGECEEPHPGGRTLCVRKPGHAGGHKDKHGMYWPRGDGDLDAALVPPAPYRMPAGELTAEDGACTATTPTGFKDAVFRCIDRAGHNGPHEAWGESGLLDRWDNEDAPLEPDDELRCDAPREGFNCTRTRGHAGDHVAHGGFPLRPLDSWPPATNAPAGTDAR